MFNDDKKNVLYNQEGLPVGINGGVARVLAKVYGFKLIVNVYSGVMTYNASTKQWNGMPDDVRFF